MTIDIIPTKEELSRTYAAIKGVKLPAVPDIVTQANEELIKPDPKIPLLAELVSKDPVLAGQVLKTVNAPFYGIKERVESVQQGVVLLGIDALKNVLISAGLRKAMEKEDDSYETFWKRSASVAACCSGLSKLVHGISADEAYMAGLFLDTGALVLLEKAPEYASAFKAQGTYPFSVIEFEEKKYRTNHAIIGYLLALAWKLPENVSLTILHHHSRNLTVFQDDRLRTLIALCQLAFGLVSEIMSKRAIDTQEHFKMLENAGDELMINTDEAKEIALECVDEAE